MSLEEQESDSKSSLYLPQRSSPGMSQDQAHQALQDATFVVSNGQDNPIHGPNGEDFQQQIDRFHKRQHFPGDFQQAIKKSRNDLVSAFRPLPLPYRAPSGFVAQQQLVSSSSPAAPFHPQTMTLQQAQSQGLLPKLFYAENPPPSPLEQSIGSVQSPYFPSNNQHVDAVESSKDFQDAQSDSKRRTAVREWGNQELSVLDPKLWDIMELEKRRQWKGIELIASENYTSQAVLEALGSHLTNKYSEGYPGARCYGGNEFIDQIETLCCSRALAAFHLDSDKWGVNVQPYSCTSANFAVFTALVQPRDRIMGLDVLSGGHPSHGYTIAGRKKVSATSIHFETLPYSVDPRTGLIDYENLDKLVGMYRPTILICGGSAYPREWNYEIFRQIADKYGAILMCDMAHISGLVATRECASPFEYCDIVTSTTHKILRGPRGGMVFFRKGARPRRNGASEESSSTYDFEERINFTIFRSLQGGPHNNHIAALAVALKQVSSDDYRLYIKLVLQNAKALADAMVKRNFKLVTGGTDNHLLLWDLRPLGITGAWFEKVTELCHITVNKCTVYGDSSARGPGGIRIGTPAMTSRGCGEKDFETIADLLARAVAIAQALQKDTKLQKDPKLLSTIYHNNKDVLELKRRVEMFSTAFEMPGFDTNRMKYR